MRDLFIVGAGGFGREAVWTVERINAASIQPVWRIVGFADDDPSRASGNFEGYDLLGSVEQASKDHPGASVFIAIGDNAARRSIYARLRGHDFPCLIDPAAQVSPTTEFRHGTYVAVGAVVSVGTEIGKFVIINARSAVGHDSSVGDFSNIAPGVSLSGHSVIGEDVFMGTNSCTAPGMKVGDGASVACGTPVLADVAPGTVLSPFGTLKRK
jgi:sugar O-acyltransferase (sialic acid O-acetyltransferase NeuD family)